MSQKRIILIKQFKIIFNYKKTIFFIVHIVKKYSFFILSKIIRNKSPPPLFLKK